MQRRFTERLECVDRMLRSRNRRIGQPLGHEDLDDLAQEVRAIAWRRLSEYRTVAALSSWVFGICEFQLRNATRRLAKRPPHIDADSLDVPVQATQPPEFFDDVHDCIHRLEEDNEAIVRMKHFEGFTLVEIAERLQLNLNTVKSRYARSLHRLRTCLEAKRTMEDL